MKSNKPISIRTKNRKTTAETIVEPEAFHQIVERHHQSLYRYFAVHIHGNLATALEMTVKAFSTIYHKPAPALKQSFTSWLFGIAWDVLNAEYSRHDGLQSGDAGANPPWLSHRLTALRAVTFYPRETFCLRFFADVAPRDIATLMDRSETTVKALVYQALLEFEAGLNGRAYVALPREQLSPLAENYHAYLDDLLAGNTPRQVLSLHAIRTTDQLKDLREALTMRSDAGSQLITRMDQVIHAAHSSTTRL